MKKKILAVDDSPSMRDMIEYTISSAGYDVVSAADGVDALEKMRAHVVDLVITDVNMPNLNGIGLVREIRSRQQYKSLPVLLLTTESGAEMKDMGRSAGATGWIVKPFDPETLISLIRRFV